MRKIFTYLIIIAFVVIGVISFLFNEFLLFPLFFCIVPCIGSYRNQRMRNAQRQSDATQQPHQEISEEPHRQENDQESIDRERLNECLNCGNIISKENLRFCEYCGAKL